MSKSYRTTVRLGASSDTDDATGVVVAQSNAVVPEPSQVVEAVQEFVGEIDQVPPVYSAAWVTGKRAYDLARKGRAVTLMPRRVSIYKIDVLRYEWPLLDLEIHCGKGTYIRSLARDLGVRLGCGGLVEMLRRTRVGPFEEQDAVGLKDSAQTAQSRVRPVLEALAELPRIVLEHEEAIRLSHGQAVVPTRTPNPIGSGRIEVAVVDPDERMVAIGRWDASNGILRPKKVWRDAQDGYTPMTL
jgi:tRNA pseudouridine55 synthase